MNGWGEARGENSCPGALTSSEIRGWEDDSEGQGEMVDITGWWRVKITAGRNQKNNTGEKREERQDAYVRKIKFLQEFLSGPCEELGEKNHSYWAKFLQQLSDKEA